MRYVFHVGGPKWALHTLGGASVEITWQEGRLDDKYSKSHPDAGSHPEAYSHQDASLHPEAKLHPEAELLEEGELTSGSGFTSGSERAGAGGQS